MSPDVVWVRMDAYMHGAEEWENEVMFAVEDAADLSVDGEFDLYGGFWTLFDPA